MKIYLILGLLLTAVCAEKKINLEDIERDNLRAEGKAKVESIQTDETKYAIKSNQQQYQIPNQYSTLGNSEPYIPPQQLQDIKYTQVPPEEYIQPNPYSVNEAQYNPSQILPQQNIQPIQYYGGYQQQVEIPTKGIAFESQKLNYQPEIAVGNHIQSVQQKAVTEKYTKTINKEPLYIDVPVTQLLSYYPQLNINPLVGLKGAELAQPPLQLATNIAQPISIPVYTPVYNQKQLVPSVKQPYPTVGPITFTTKAPKGSSYTIPIASKKKINSTPLLTPPLYVQPQQPLNQGKTLLHTQAYVTSPQPQYVQQLVYTQPGIVYNDPAAAYSDLYARLPAYIQDNFLRGQVNQYQTQQQLYTTPIISQAETPKEVLQEQVNQDISQNYNKVPDEPKTHFVPPQFPPHDFKAGSAQLEPIRGPFENEQTLPVQDHSFPSEPRSLLDTYIPSKVIAAQDTARYRERPIKLEGGFLPSKVNFAPKKRKSE
ncbi:probable basic-leucine zipper transcription factor I isoform X2 [Pogonomyrmex barbatus]|uniref:Probable basic-leucine zipper transcription factor I isoform X1 n=1 Tax=Pogonomyrmex barbatus TaxID=144034 RepID=A0A6I9WE31_9HYME|nr:probable basic-leucine zipper transcription factor I isoform X1 [Pogonomyrmex barbatus]XP_011639201.1 probable basic-leucine zipper transcription factor I isoform X2 [Pogonomyrmex barbatus]